MTARASVAVRDARVLAAGVQRRRRRVACAAQLGVRVAAAPIMSVVARAVHVVLVLLVLLVRVPVAGLLLVLGRLVRVHVHVRVGRVAEVLQVGEHVVGLAPVGRHRRGGDSEAHLRLVVAQLRVFASEEDGKVCVGNSVFNLASGPLY